MTSQIHVRACLLVVHHQRILLVPHFDTDVGPLQYNVPGGRVETGESLHQTALREFQEETGFEAVCNGLFDIYEHHRCHWHSVTIGFWGSITGGVLRAEKTQWGERLPRWLAADDIATVPCHPLPLIQKALRTLGH